MSFEKDILEKLKEAQSLSSSKIIHSHTYTW